MGQPVATAASTSCSHTRRSGLRASVQSSSRVDSTLMISQTIGLPAQVPFSR